jgi:hypothetical protein
MHHGVARDGIVELLHLRLGRQVAVQQQVAGLKEGGMFGQFADGIAAIFQDALVAIDESNFAFGRGGGGEAGVVGEDVGLVVELADVHDIGALGAGIDREVVALALIGQAGRTRRLDLALFHAPFPLSCGAAIYAKSFPGHYLEAGKGGGFSQSV